MWADGPWKTQKKVLKSSNHLYNGVLVAEPFLGRSDWKSYNLKSQDHSFHIVVKALRITILK